MRRFIECLIFLVCIDAHKILVYNFKFAHSHSNYLGNIADILVDAGHNVTSLIPEIATNLKDGTVKSNAIRIPADPEVVQKYAKVDSGEVNFFSLSELNPIIPLMMSTEAGYMFAKTCAATLDSGEIEKLEREHFDVYLVETFDICGMMLTHLLKPRSVIMTSTTILAGAHYDEVGVPTALSYNPASLTRNLDVHSFLSRAWNLYAEIITRLQFYGPRRQVSDLFRQRFGSDYPTLKEISANVSYVFTNSEPLIDFATPTISRVIDIGGLGAKEPRELDEYWKSVMTRRPKVVLISFGSIAKSFLLTPADKQSILKVVTSFPAITFIWKYEKKDEFAQEIAAKIENLILTDWMPQNDLLNHPNLAVFITHGGMGSVQELALRGKPAVLIPIFGDQPRNAAMMEHNGMGKVLSKLEVGDAEKIVSLLKELIEDKKYAENAKRVARMLAKKPFSSKEKLLKYIDFAAEFGHSSALRPRHLDMSLIEYHNLDIVFVGIVCLLIVAFLLLKITCFSLKKDIRKEKTA